MSSSYKIIKAVEKLELNLCKSMGRKMREGSQETLPKSEIIRRVAVPVEATSCSQAPPPRLTREVGAAAAVEEVCRARCTST